ncbi:SDR family oxidoreductase [Anaerolineae bacterium CFX4]|nr:SDR family oxidoreductase [Anaerolineae bacterium CFX4]
MLENKVILITGAAGGLGRATALAAARYGAKLALCDLHQAGVDETAEMARALGSEAISAPVDVSAAHEVEAFVKSAAGAFGMLDGAFNNAGVGGTLSRTHMLTEEQWDQTMAVNLKGVWLCMKYEYPYMRREGGGAIVNMASVAGLIGFPMNAVYAASKHGVIGLRPGMVDKTLESVPMRRLGKPEEVAETVCFLLSDRAPFLTGQAIAIDGGLINV